GIRNWELGIKDHDFRILNSQFLIADCSFPFRRGNLLDPPLMTSALERRGEPQRQDLVGEAERDNASAHRKHVGVVVLARQPRRIEIVAERRTDAGDLVRCDLLALTAAAEDDAALDAALDDGARDV